MEAVQFYLTTMKVQELEYEYHSLKTQVEDMDSRFTTSVDKLTQRMDSLTNEREIKSYMAYLQQISHLQKQEIVDTFKYYDSDTKIRRE